MKKPLKTALIILIAVVLLGCAIGGYFIWRHTTTYIGQDAAMQIALSDAKLNIAAVHNTDVDFDKNKFTAWYEIDFDSADTEYEYSIDAATGEILYSYSEPVHSH